MFEGWGNYYFMLGSAGAAFLGVMALVATLTTNSNRRRAERGQRLYLTPTVFNLAAVLTFSAVALFPKTAPIIHQVMLGALSLYGLGYATVLLLQHSKVEPDMRSHWSDYWCYAFAPFAAFVAIACAVAATLIERGLGCDGLALGLLALLLISIRNGWDLVTWLAPMRNSEPGANDGGN